jgi:hypothetical protein
MWTNPRSPSRGIPGLLLLLDRLGGSPPWRSRTGERPLPLDQFWSSVFMAVPVVKAASVGMLIPPLVGAISWDCHAGERWRKRKGQVVVRDFLSWRAFSAKRTTKNLKAADWKFLLVDVASRRQKSRCIAGRGRGWCWGRTVIHSWNLEKLFCRRW